MSEGTTVLLGAFAGLTIFLGLPVARFRGLSRGAQGFLNALALGILVFLLWDVLSKANEPVEQSLDGLHHGDVAGFLLLVLLFAGGIGLGLLSLVYVNGRIGGRFARRPARGLRGPGAAVAAEASGMPSGRWLAMMIAMGLGLHNFSEGLAIGQSAVSGAISLAAVLIIGFALHNVTEGFGVAAPMSSDAAPPSWGFLGLAGLIGGGPTFLGTVIGYSLTSRYVFVLFLTLAAGALLYVINEMFAVGRKLNRPVVLGWGILLGFLAGYATDLILTYAGS
ncbi:MAG TPA: ZIP family metal transporter [Candidatus Dormibacteraeota bacterium]|nr:ZIP family metal transporter [Candidatus Dormibacteraeota bacterium]